MWFESTWTLARYDSVWPGMARYSLAQCRQSVDRVRIKVRIHECVDMIQIQHRHRHSTDMISTNLAYSGKKRHKGEWFGEIFFTCAFAISSSRRRRRLYCNLVVVLLFHHAVIPPDPIKKKKKKTQWNKNGTFFMFEIFSSFF